MRFSGVDDKSLMPRPLKYPGQIACFESWRLELDVVRTNHSRLTCADPAAKMSCMPHIRSSPLLLVSFVIAGVAFQTACAPSSPPDAGSKTPAAPASAAGARSTRYEDLVTLFADWRAFQRPKIVNGVPDYSAAA